MSDDKVRAMRNFGNKVWNVGRFLKISLEEVGISSYKDLVPYSKKLKDKLTKDDKAIIKKYEDLVENVSTYLGKYRFDLALEAIYHFLWDSLASDYLEHIKTRTDKEFALSVFRYTYLNSLKLLHPFMPFITEAIWAELKDIRKYPEMPLAISQWPKNKTQ